MKFLTLFFPLLFFSCVTPDEKTGEAKHPSLLEISKLSDIEEKILAKATRHDLVVFDIDYVLFAPKDKILRPCGEAGNLRKRFFDELKRKIEKKKGLDFQDHLMLMQEQASFEAVHPQFPLFHKKLNALNIQTVALSHNKNIQQNSKKSLIHLYNERLKTLGHKFSFEKEKISLKNGTFYKGVIFTEGADKGEVLKNFIHNLEEKPKRIFFVDDRIKWLHSVSKACQELGIDFLGFHDTELLKKDEAINSIVAGKQFEVLFNEKKWLSDEEAKLRGCISSKKP